MPLDLPSHTLILEIEVPGFWIDDGAQETADTLYEGNVTPIVLREWMYPNVGLTLVSAPSEKQQNHEFQVHGMDGRIVGARIASRAK